MENEPRTWLERVVVTLSPSLKIRHQRWKTPWEQKERRAFVFGARVFFTFFLCAYVLHYFFIDLPLKKEPISLWAAYRFSLAAVAAIGLGLTFTSWFRLSKYYRFPLIVSGLLFSVMQAQSMVWRKEVPYFYSIVLPVIAGVALRKSIFESFLYLGLSYALEYQAWQTRPQEVPYIWSMAIVGWIFVAVLRSRMSTDVDAFISDQERLETQSLLVEAQRELNEQIRSFLPKEVYRRIIEMVHRDKKTVLQAMDEILRPREALVTCVFSDIRGYTHLSRAVSGYIAESVIPSQKAYTDVVEQYSGIPRLTGDLVFAYFESANPIASFQQALLCAFSLGEKNKDLNLKLSTDQQVQRYVLLSFGKAVVGNIGGTDGSRDISVLGDPANILSRIDPLTKEVGFRTSLNSPCVVITNAAAEMAARLFPNLKQERVDLAAQKIILRDFQDEKFLFVIPITLANKQAISKVGEVAPAMEYLLREYINVNISEQKKAA